VFLDLHRHRRLMLVDEAFVDDGAVPGERLAVNLVT
jgi:hypothetical protein